MQTQLFDFILDNIVAIISLVFAIISFVLSIKLKRNTLKSGCAIVDRFHEDNYAIAIVNRGSNPIKITYISAEIGDGGPKYEEKEEGKKTPASGYNDLKPIKYFIDIMPKVNQEWKGFSLRIVGRWIPPNDEIVLFAIAPKDEKTRKDILNAMCSLKINIDYQDISGKKHKKAASYKSYADFFLDGQYKVGK